MTEKDWPFEHFKREEFCCKCGCGFCDINLRLVKKLDLVRHLYRQPIFVSSGCRCPKHNREVDGSATSSHLKGLAADLYCEGSRWRYELIEVLVKYFNRIGIGENFIHVDIDENKPADVMWLYPVSTGMWA